MSLLLSDDNTTDIPQDIPSNSNYCFYKLFENCASLITAPDLPATSLEKHCYDSMFYECSNLIKAPDLPATLLEEHCYDSMFYSCINLTVAPELPALTLSEHCYDSMFRNCRNLNYIKASFTTIPSESFTNNWVSSVSLYGTFYKNSIADWDVTGPNGIPVGWDVITDS